MNISLSLQVIVVWVGTNNHENTAEEVAGGIEAIVRLINTQQPQAKVIVLVCPCSLAVPLPYWESLGVLGGQSLDLSSALCLPSLAWLCRSSALALPKLGGLIPTY